MEHFYIIANQHKEGAEVLRDQIVDYLVSHGKTCGFQADHDAARKAGYNYTDPTMIPDDVEVVIVLGGDGTVIGAAADLARRDIPILGINFGTLGFLTETESADVNMALDALMEGDFLIEERMMLAGEVIGKRETSPWYRALNDIVISRMGVPHIIDFDLYVNGQYLKSYKADGMIVSTPTGSTGYNLSAGGPIVEPQAKLMVITPISPHSLNGRSIILSDEDIIEVVIGPGRKTAVETAAATFDGGTCVELDSEERIRIRKSHRNTKLIRLKTSSFLEVLSRKLQ